MNIAIVIGTSQYETLQQLPSCKKDATIFYNILTKSSKYDDILLLMENTTSLYIKEKIIDFIQKYKNSNIEEFIIYFSGHGSFDGKEFYYLCSDYNSTKIKQTSLENKELDNYIRLLNPTLTVKVVDSCESGVHYIKDTNNFNDYLQKNQQNFNNCYFLYSSQNNQSSYADSNLSFFTKVLIESIINLKTENIRYKDIIDYISDSFSNDQEQKPLFIAQAEFTEKFIHITFNQKEKLKQELEEVIIKTEVIKNNEKSLLELVQNDSKNYLDKDKIILILNEIKNKINDFQFNNDDFINIDFLTNSKILFENLKIYIYVKLHKILHIYNSIILKL